MLTHKSLLEAYVYAKDKCCPGLIHDIFEPNALLAISVAGETISFPPLVVGAEGIAQTLVTDFGRQFTQCRTYYLADVPTSAGGRIDHFPWLVIMRDQAQGSLRIGRGSYRWLFSPYGKGWRISEMHIRIDRMDVLPDRVGGLRTTLQSFLPYPWLQPTVLDEAFAPLARCNPAFAFVSEFVSTRFERPEQEVIAPV
ncbi:hypothetical protein [Herbaspirillum robiniae]|uniref:SnoaL-like domain-containing protein n=1 Tax=Herbaspirillum robiniae TaxID=2014887 RepID=A0ABX2M219_9BURK|nr:hypothetical protein [Herbaspirillum robiniae]NUU04410.1 hypothetical protein [Herbaspirillum robiniae]